MPEGQTVPAGQIAEGGAWRSPDLVQFMPTVANVSDDVFYGNIRAACARDLPWLQAVEPHDGHAVIVGGGPSLADTVEEIRWRKSLGQTVVALNNSAAWLLARGIRPDAQVILEARPSAARFVQPCPALYIASQCAPETFEAALAAWPWGGRVTLWHPHVAGIHEIIGDRITAMIGGGTTVGMTSIALFFALGYRKLHLYGFDSCYQGDACHAYAQAENDGEEVIEVEVRGRRFRVARWMAHQADEFKNVAAQVAAEDGIITVAGSGLIEHIAREMMRPVDPSAACYDLSRAPASWDFFVWLITAEMDRRRRGAPAPLKVAFSPGPNGGFRDDALPWSPEQRQHFLDSVMRPSLALIGAVEDASAVYGRTHEYFFRGICAASRAGEEVPACEPAGLPLEIRRRFCTTPVVITLREATHWPMRNSNLEAWRRFGRWLKNQGELVVFVRDTEKADEPMIDAEFAFLAMPKASRDPLARAALYARAKINLFVANGPAALAIFGRAPWLMFKPTLEVGPNSSSPEWWEKMVGVKPGEQFPWSGPQQRIVWADDTFENIKTAYEDVMRRPTDQPTDQPRAPDGALSFGGQHA